MSIASTDKPQNASPESAVNTVIAETNLSSQPTYSLNRTAITILASLVVALPVAGFGLGWLAGRAAPAVQSTRVRQPALLAGEVLQADGDGDSSAVILLFPVDSAPSSGDRLVVEPLQPSAEPIKPGSALHRRLRSMDADTTRTDGRGSFTVRAPDVGEYYLLVLSARQNSQATVIPREHIAQLGRYVDRPADLIRNHLYRWQQVDIAGDRFDIAVQWSY